MVDVGTIGVLGGTFDPPHLSHFELARIALDSRQVDMVLFIPCLQHAFNKTPVSFAHRLAMCQAMVENESHMAVSDIETHMAHPGRTVELLEVLRIQYPHAPMRLIAGGDIYLQRTKWYRFELVEKLAPPLYAERVGVPTPAIDTLKAPLPISSTEIRRRLRDGESVARFLHPAVNRYITNNGIYKREYDNG